MAIVKVIEVMAESPTSWDDAAKVAVREASQTIKNIKSIYAKEMQAIVENDKVISYRLNAKISFLVEK